MYYSILFFFRIEATDSVTDLFGNTQYYYESTLYHLSHFLDEHNCRREREIKTAGPSSR